MNLFSMPVCSWWFRFGSVRFRFLVFGIGPVRFLFGFGSCGSWSISVRFGSVFGTFCIDICFFSGVGKANTDCFLQEVYSSGLSRCLKAMWRMCHVEVLVTHGVSIRVLLEHASQKNVGLLSSMAAFTG